MSSHRPLAAATRPRELVTIYHHFFAVMIVFTVRGVSRLFVAILLSLFFAVTHADQNHSEDHSGEEGEG